MSRRKKIYLLIFLFILLFAINYKWLNDFLEKEFSNEQNAVVLRIVDGDTIEIENKTIVRLFGINTPERGEKYYPEAKEFLEKEILNKSVFIEFFGKDKYYRELGVIFSAGNNFNARVIEEGFANPYILDNKKYEIIFREAWEKCIIDEKNLCEPSKDKCASCIFLKELSMKKQEVVLLNNCGFSCNLTDWKIKDEGRKKFIFGKTILESGKEIKIIAEDFEQDYVWTATGDSLFLRDSEGKLVLWERVE